MAHSDDPQNPHAGKRGAVPAAEPSFDEFERLSGAFRPSWELDDAPFENGPGLRQGALQDNAVAAPDPSARPSLDVQNAAKASNQRPGAETLIVGSFGPNASNGMSARTPAPSHVVSASSVPVAPQPPVPTQVQPSSTVQIPRQIQLPVPQAAGPRTVWGPAPAASTSSLQGGLDEFDGPVRRRQAPYTRWVIGGTLGLGLVVGVAAWIATRSAGSDDASTAPTLAATPVAKPPTPPAETAAAAPQPPAPAPPTVDSAASAQAPSPPPPTEPVAVPPPAQTPAEPTTAPKAAPPVQPAWHPTEAPAPAPQPRAVPASAEANPAPKPAAARPKPAATTIVHDVPF